MELYHIVPTLAVHMIIKQLLPTPAILGSSWVEMQQELVRAMDPVPMECGVAQLQSVQVSMIYVAPVYISTLF